VGTSTARPEERPGHGLVAFPRRNQKASKHDKTEKLESGHINEKVGAKRNEKRNVKKARK